MRIDALLDAPPLVQRGMFWVMKPFEAAPPHCRGQSAENRALATAAESCGDGGAVMNPGPEGLACDPDHNSSPRLQPYVSPVQTTMCNYARDEGRSGADLKPPQAAVIQATVVNVAGIGQVKLR